MTQYWPAIPGKVPRLLHPGAGMAIFADGADGYGSGV